VATNDALSGPNRLRAASQSGARRSGVRAAAFWGIAIVMGLVAALAITRYLERRTVSVSTPTSKIVVAAMDLPLATHLRPEQLRMADWPVTAMPPGAIRDVKEAIDHILTSRVLEGEPLLPGKLAARDAGNGLAALIPSNMRAIAVRVDDVVGVAGFIHPDDRVDVIVTIHPTKGGDTEPISKVILQNVKVLAVGKELETSARDRNMANSVTVATLLVNPEESEKLALSATEGKLMLTLRSWTDNQAVITQGMNASTLITGDSTKPREAVVVAPPPRRPPVRVAQAAPTPPPVAATQPQQGSGNVVEILRGDRFEQRKFEAKDKQ
jgi:pilus assembly protein CpaB